MLGFSSKTDSVKDSVNVSQSSWKIFDKPDVERLNRRWLSQDLWFTFGRFAFQPASQRLLFEDDDRAQLAPLPATLLELLLVAQGHAVTFEAAVAVLWPDSAPNTYAKDRKEYADLWINADQNVHNTLRTLRRGLSLDSVISGKLTSKQHRRRITFLTADDKVSIDPSRANGPLVPWADVTDALSQRLSNLADVTDALSQRLSKLASPTSIDVKELVVRVVEEHMASEKFMLSVIHRALECFVPLLSPQSTLGELPHIALRVLAMQKNRYTTQEIAEHLGVNEAEVTHLARRAIDQLLGGGGGGQR